ncbi:unnamed protein product [Caenorhabditis sp. 36 PRJEB53466]|nr:unnamed protein product [Caenorhabditis sp. 36 PRJEB53466]
MTLSPVPIDSSFDGSEVATPCTVIARKSVRRQPDTDYEEDEEEEEVDDISTIYDDDTEEGSSEDATSGAHLLPRQSTFARCITKVYCYVDDQQRCEKDACKDKLQVFTAWHMTRILEEL